MSVTAFIIFCINPGHAIMASFELTRIAYPPHMRVQAAALSCLDAPALSPCAVVLLSKCEHSVSFNTFGQRCWARIVLDVSIFMQVPHPSLQVVHCDPQFKLRVWVGRLCDPLRSTEVAIVLPGPENSLPLLASSLVANSPVDFKVTAAL